MNSAQLYCRSFQTLLAPVVRWALRSGVGYGQFIRLLKPLFFRSAKEELTRQGSRHTGAALSYVSGLHRTDVATFLARSNDDLEQQWHDIYRISPGNQVIARWVIEKLPQVISLNGGPDSFKGLVRRVQSESGGVWSLHLILQDLQRRKLVTQDGCRVCFLREVGEFDGNHANDVNEFIGAITDHLNTGLGNLTGEFAPRRLEQSLVADELTFESVLLLQSMARQWWLQAVRELGGRAVECSDRDAVQGGNHRMRIGLYFYTEKMNSPSTFEAGR